MPHVASIRNLYRPRNHAIDHRRQLDLNCSVLRHLEYVSLGRFSGESDEVLVNSSLAAWAGNETPRKWQGGALKLLSQLDLGVAKVVRTRRR